MLIVATLLCLVADGYLIFRAEYRNSLICLAFTFLFAAVCTGYVALGMLVDCVLAGLYLGTGGLVAYKELSSSKEAGWKFYSKCGAAVAQVLGFFASLSWMLTILLQHP